MYQTLSIPNLMCCVLDVVALYKCLRCMYVSFSWTAVLKKVFTVTSLVTQFRCFHWHHKFQHWFCFLATHQAMWKRSPPWPSSMTARCWPLPLALMAWPPVRSVYGTSRQRCAPRYCPTMSMTSSAWHTPGTTDSWSLLVRKTRTNWKLKCFI